MAKVYLRKVPGAYFGSGDPRCIALDGTQCYFLMKSVMACPCNGEAFVFIPIPESEAKEIMFKRMLRKLEAMDASTR